MRNRDQYSATYNERNLSRLTITQAGTRKRKTIYLCYLTPACRETGERGYLGSIQRDADKWSALAVGSDGSLLQRPIAISDSREKAWQALADHARTTQHGRNAYRQAARLERSRALAGVREEG